jgi:hypothetical protein
VWTGVASQFAPIPRRECPAPEAFVREFVDARQPVVITGALRDDARLSDWTVDALVARYGSMRVVTQLRTGRRYDDLHREPMALSQFVELMRRGEAAGQRCLSSPRPFRELPGLVQSAEVPRYVPSDRKRQLFFFVSPADLVTPFHYDFSHNLHAQLHGRKRFVLVAPRDARRLNHPPVWKRDFFISPIDAEEPDLARHPDFAHVQRYACVLQPTEMLFIPSGYRHQVRALEESVSIGFFWAHTLKQSAALRALALVGRPMT